MSITVQDVSPRVYVASLSDYNAGRLHGAWVDVTDPDTMMGEIQAMLSTSPEPDAEEWALHDYEGFGSLRLSEYESLERVAAMAEFIREDDELAILLLDHYGGDVKEARRAREEDYAGCYQGLEHFAEELTEETGSLSQVPECLKNYIDYESMAHDMELNGDVFTIEAGYQQVHVFWNR